MTFVADHHLAFALLLILKALNDFKRSNCSSKKLKVLIKLQQQVSVKWRSSALVDTLSSALKISAATSSVTLATKRVYTEPLLAGNGCIRVKKGLLLNCRLDFNSVAKSHMSLADLRDIPNMHL